MIKEYKLKCCFDSRKSFYGKAVIKLYEDDDVIKKELLSYGTLVAQLVYYKKKKKIVYEYFGRYSQTTSRHQREFFRQECLNENKLKELFKSGRLEEDFYYYR